MFYLMEGLNVFRLPGLSSRWSGFLLVLSVLGLTGCPTSTSQPDDRDVSSRVGLTPTKLRRVRVVSITPVPNPEDRLPLKRLAPLPRLHPQKQRTQPTSRPVAARTIARSTPPAAPPAADSQLLYSKAPVMEKKPLPALDPKEVFHPIPFDLELETVEKRYSQMYAAADNLKIGPMEKHFLKQLWQERRREGMSRSYRNQLVRLAGIRYLRMRGLKKYQLMGYRLLQEMEQQLQEYLAEGGSPLTVPQGNGKLAKRAQKLIEYTGYYPMLLKQIGVKPNASTVSRTQRFWLRTLFMARWALQAWGVYPLPAMLGREVYLDYMKARILWTKGLQKRLFAVRESRRLNPRFPVYRVLGWLFLQEGRIDTARSSFRDALRRDPNDQLSRTLLDKISRPPT